MLNKQVFIEWMNTSYLLHAYFVQGTVRNASHMLNHLILITPYEVGASIC